MDLNQQPQGHEPHTLSQVELSTTYLSNVLQPPFYKGGLLHILPFYGPTHQASLSEQAHKRVGCVATPPFQKGACPLSKMGGLLHICIGNLYKTPTHLLDTLLLYKVAVFNREVNYYYCAICWNNLSNYITQVISLLRSFTPFFMLFSMHLKRVPPFKCIEKSIGCVVFLCFFLCI